MPLPRTILRLVRHMHGLFHIPVRWSASVIGISTLLRRRVVESRMQARTSSHRGITTTSRRTALIARYVVERKGQGVGRGQHAHLRRCDNVIQGIRVCSGISRAFARPPIVAIHSSCVRILGGGSRRGRLRGGVGVALADDAAFEPKAGLGAAATTTSARGTAAAEWPRMGW